MNILFPLILAIISLSLALFLLGYNLGKAWGDKEFPPKVVTMNLTRGEMVYCFYGNPEIPTVVCDSMELKSNFMMVDRFLEMMEFGK